MASSATAQSQVNRTTTGTSKVNVSPTRMTLPRLELDKLLKLLKILFTHSEGKKAVRHKILCAYNYFAKCMYLQRYSLIVED